MTDDENDSDLDSVPRRRNNTSISKDNDGDLSPGIYLIFKNQKNCVFFKLKSTQTVLIMQNFMKIKYFINLL